MAKINTPFRIIKITTEHVPSPHNPWLPAGAIKTRRFPLGSPVATLEIDRTIDRPDAEIIMIRTSNRHPPPPGYEPARGTKVYWDRPRELLERMGAISSLERPSHDPPDTYETQWSSPTPTHSGPSPMEVPAAPSTTGRSTYVGSNDRTAGFPQWKKFKDMGDYDFRDQLLELIIKYSDLGITDAVRARLRALLGRQDPASNDELLNVIKDCQNRAHCGTLQIKALQLAWKACQTQDDQDQPTQDNITATEIIMRNWTNWTQENH